jgi:hypothetical protein
LQTAFWEAKTTPAAPIIVTTLRSLEVPLATLAAASSPFSSALEATEKFYHALVTIWETVEPCSPFAFPGLRMDNLLRLLGSHISNYVRAKLNVFCKHGQQDGEAKGDGGMWSPESSAHVEAEVDDALELLLTWRDRHVRQMMLDWVPGPQAISKNAWRLEPFRDTAVGALVERLEEVRDLLGLRKELIRALAREHRRAVEDVFSALHRVDAFMVWPASFQAQVASVSPT